MNMKFYSIASGSSGNSYVVSAGGTHLLIDVGISGKRIIEGLRNIDVLPEDLAGILITHEHSDHVKSIKKISTLAGKAKVYASSGTSYKLADKVDNEKWHILSAGDVTNINGILVRAFRLSHDAEEPLGYSFSYNGKKLVIATDTGIITDEIIAEMMGSDLVVIEANYEHNMLLYGSYPYSLKQRIKGELGHLSNDDCATLIVDILRQRMNQNVYNKLKVLIAHISKENNTPELAYMTIKNILDDHNFNIEEDLVLEILLRDNCCGIYEV